jgi:N-acetylmuramoyl-L-alanine amidase
LFNIHKRSVYLWFNFLEYDYVSLRKLNYISYLLRRIKMKKLWKIFIVILVNALIITMLLYGMPKEINHLSVLNINVQALSKQGSRGSEVKNIQTALKNLGLYNGRVDGIFGIQTKNAVIAFQKQRGLTADGIAGPRTLSSLGISSGGSSGSSSSDIDLLARVISAEARGEPYNGQVAVGAVILNRVSHPSFPDTLAGVIYQPGAFTCMSDGQINQPVSDSSKRAARDAINGVDPSGGAIYYYNPQTATSDWIWSRPVITVIGKHKFCS